ncbi:ABC transporter ATP-binding protein [Ensifer sp. YR511]|uniref:ABC transporter ATP-binding protein n=1 Tax=Ensifer sp. YR511 TaxID=1855294 RepID=UPI00088FC01F|nr:ABC transporter ATP-binding protein [Ensifer sp. YR511]SDN34631.1 NitT/TauT family transport system ATP-binding protein [Ensifer sp. YR511]
MSFAINSKALDVGYQGVNSNITVLSGLDLKVETGRFLSILGPSGCGKSTFLRVVADLLNPLAGHLEVLGGSPYAARSRRDVGFVFQEPTLLPWRTVRDNVLLPVDVGRAKLTRSITDRSDELLELMGLTPLAKRLPHELSGGQRQRVAIARALLGEPRLLLMDEPFGALDEITRDRLNDELLNIWRQTATTVLFVTHSVMEAAYLGERVIVLAANPGRVVFDLDMTATKQPGNRCHREDSNIVQAMGTLRAALERAS